MTASEIIRDVISKSELKQGAIAAGMGLTSTGLSNRLRRNSLSADYFLRLLDYLGYDFQILRRSTGKIEKVRKKGVGKHIVRKIKGVVYDTNKADAICHSAADEMCFCELYKDDDDRYFVAQYAKWEDGKDYISPISAEDAEIIKDKYAFVD